MSNAVYGNETIIRMVTGDEIIWEEVLCTRKGWAKNIGAEAGDEIVFKRLLSLYSRYWEVLGSELKGL